MFKKNDKIKLKSNVTGEMLGRVGLSLTYFKGKDEGKFLGFHGNYYSAKLGEKGNDAIIKIPHIRYSGEFHEFYIPSAWVELAARKGHHLTKIFQ